MNTKNFRAPSIFLGHGSPMNVIEDNDFNREFKKLGENLKLDQIKGIIAISAHWQTTGIKIQNSDFPKTIHDFYGFPETLYTMEYKAPGSKDLAKKVAAILKNDNAHLTDEWGLDHGIWNVLWHLIPKANIPVVALSLNFDFSMQNHFEIGQKLRELRDEGYMIITSGNIVHSFRGIDFSNTQGANPLANKFNDYAKNMIDQKNLEGLLSFSDEIMPSAQFSINSAEHYIPIFYTLATSFEDEKANFFNNQIVFSTLSMLSFGYGI